MKGTPQTNLAAIVDTSASSTIVASAGEHGKIQPSGAVPVGSGANATFTMVPAACYHPSELIVDGTPVEPSASYTFPSVTFDHTIEVRFEQDRDGQACDDGNVCTHGEVCTSGDCLGSPSVPQEVGPTVGVVRSGKTALISWSLAACATSSSVLSGLLANLPVGPGGSDEVCLASGLSPTTLSITDAVKPPIGEGFWYLVRGDNVIGHGPLGFQSVNGTPTVPRVSTTCP
jgi:hypothetical protein